MRRPVSRAAGRAVAAVAVAALTGCQLGERPVLAPAPQPTGDAAADAVLLRFDGATSEAFTADYVITTPLGATAEARVDQAGRSRRTVDIGAVHYVVDGPTSQTCTPTPDDCRVGLDSQPLSDLAVTPDFYALSPAARLRRDVAVRVGPTEASTETIAGQPATCVLIPVSATTARYCALDAGPLASLRTTDVTIELTAYSP